MGLVSAKCPNCGATIQLDSSRAEGFCLYCGSRIKVQDAIKTIKVDRSKDIRNYLNMAMAAIEAHNGDEALEYSNKALEVDSENAEAWYLKMRSVQINTSVYSMKIEEILTAGNNAISYSKSQDMEDKVYAFYIDTCCYDLGLCINEMSEDSNFKENFHFLCSKIIKKFSTVESYVLSLRKAVPDNAIADSEELQRLTKKLANQLNDYRNSIIRNQRVQGEPVNYTTMRNFLPQLDAIQQGLPDGEKIRMTDYDYSMESKHNNGESIKEIIQTVAALAVVVSIILMIYGVNKLNAHIVIIGFVGLLISVPIAMIMNCV